MLDLVLLSHRVAVKPAVKIIYRASTRRYVELNSGPADFAADGQGLGGLETSLAPSARRPEALAARPRVIMAS